jgi:hypothetical protein
MVMKKLWYHHVYSALSHVLVLVKHKWPENRRGRSSRYNLFSLKGLSNGKEKISGGLIGVFHGFKAAKVSGKRAQLLNTSVVMILPTVTLTCPYAISILPL